MGKPFNCTSGFSWILGAEEMLISHDDFFSQSRRTAGACEWLQELANNMWQRYCPCWVLLSITELKHSSFFCSFLLSSLCIAAFTNSCMAVLNPLCQRLLDYYTSPIIAFLSPLLLLICAYWRITNTFIYLVHLFPSFLCHPLQALSHRPRSR